MQERVGGRRRLADLTLGFAAGRGSRRRGCSGRRSASSARPRRHSYASRRRREPRSRRRREQTAVVVNVGGGRVGGRGEATDAALDRLARRRRRPRGTGIGLRTEVRFDA